MNSIICLNIIGKDNKLINPNGITTPILYSWANEDDLFSTMRKDEGFYEYLSNVCFNMNNYQYVKMCFIKYDIQNDTFENNEYIIQNEYKLKDIEDNNTFYLDYIVEILKGLYNYSIKKEYIINDKEMTKLDIILNIYTELKNKFEKRILSETFINYVRSELQQKYSLNSDNTEYIVNKFKELIQ